MSKTGWDDALYKFGHELLGKSDEIFNNQFNSDTNANKFNTRILNKALPQDVKNFMKWIGRLNNAIISLSKSYQKMRIKSLDL